MNRVVSFLVAGVFLGLWGCNGGTTTTTTTTPTPCPACPEAPSDPEPLADGHRVASVESGTFEIYNPQGVLGGVVIRFKDGTMELVAINKEANGNKGLPLRWTEAHFKLAQGPADSPGGDELDALKAAYNTWLNNRPNWQTDLLVVRDTIITSNLASSCPSDNAPNVLLPGSYEVQELLSGKTFAMVLINAGVAGTAGQLSQGQDLVVTAGKNDLPLGGDSDTSGAAPKGGFVMRSRYTPTVPTGFTCGGDVWKDAAKEFEKVVPGSIDYTRLIKRVQVWPTPAP